MSYIDKITTNTNEVTWSSVALPSVIIVGVGLLAAPMVIQSSYFGLTSHLILMFAVMAVGYNVILGWPNMLVFAPSAFAIIGGVTSALLAMQLDVPVLIALIIGGVIASITGMLVALGAIVVGSAFEVVITTLAFEHIVFYLLTNWKMVGPMGISGVPDPSLGSILIADQIGQYLFLLAILAVVVLLVTVFDRSLIGTLTVATGENEELLRSIGYNPSRYKIIAIALGAFILGVGGGLYAHINSLITPGSFGIQQTIFLMTIVIVGGMRRILGPVVGAIIMVSIPELTRLFGIGQIRAYIVGSALVLVVMFFPDGVLGSFGSNWRGGDVQWRFWR
jgi:branched-chain amino acid transport system permease protein